MAGFGRSELFQIYHLFFLSRNMGFLNAKITSDMVTIPKVKNNSLRGRFFFFPFLLYLPWNKFSGMLIEWSGFLRS